MPKPRTLIQLALAMPAAFALGCVIAAVAMVSYAAAWWVW
jgi:hypothetical protein